MKLYRHAFALGPPEDVLCLCKMIFLLFRAMFSTSMNKGFQAVTDGCNFGS
jgi:hypothetical protein